MPTRILVVEDEPMLQRVLGQMLQQNCTVTVASNVDTAVEYLGTCEFDIVVADLELGEKKRNGAWVLCEVGVAQPKARRLLISGHHFVLDEPAERFNAHAVLAKPFTRDELLEALGAPAPRGTAYA